MLVQLLYR